MLNEKLESQELLKIDIKYWETILKKQHDDVSVYYELYDTSVVCDKYKLYGYGDKRNCLKCPIYEVTDTQYCDTRRDIVYQFDSFAHYDCQLENLIGDGKFSLELFNIIEGIKYNLHREFWNHLHLLVGVLNNVKQ